MPPFPVVLFYHFVPGYLLSRTCPSSQTNRSKRSCHPCSTPHTIPRPWGNAYQLKIRRHLLSQRVHYTPPLIPISVSSCRRDGKRRFVRGGWGLCNKWQITANVYNPEEALILLSPPRLLVTTAQRLRSSCVIHQLRCRMTITLSFRLWDMQQFSGVQRTCLSAARL